MKKIFAAFLFCLISLVNLSVFAEQQSRGGYGNDPLEVLDRVVGEANKDVQFQETALDNITDKEGSFQAQYKISNTLDYLRINIAPYLQWAVYIGLVVAVILIVYNGFLMVTHTINKEGDFGKVKARIGYIAVGVLLLTGFYAIIKLVVGLINSIFGSGPSGDTGF
ncbi:hypothetical protein P148_SR1C00001G0154 [candidate division SR1 bacterium RAAC1_SR1_1]|nr:hypothetical protein P148_SR1C00001G0154 [candidate division SR1 bacterium RAAC1_SR1_1]